jgi:hypothetical protein
MKRKRDDMKDDSEIKICGEKQYIPLYPELSPGGYKNFG